MKKAVNKILFKYLIFLRKLLYVSFYFYDKYFLKQKPKIIILCYHSISESYWRFSVSFNKFKQQINYLQKIGYQFISISEFVDYLNKKREILKPSVIITFDDGYADLLQTTQFLKKFDIKPTLFLLSDPNHANRKELETNKVFLSKFEILKLINDNWEIGCHTATLSNMNQQNDSQIHTEIIESRKNLEKQLPISIKYFAYPKGKYNPKVLASVKDAGYKVALTMDDAIISKESNPHLIPRIGVDGSHSFWEFRGAISQSAILFRKYIKEKTILGRYL